MRYPGNPSLSPDVQEKTKATFQQALDLVAQGKDQEALAGCEFILGLDPLFLPARKLQERLRSPARPVKLDDLGPDLDPGSGSSPAIGLPPVEPPGIPAGPSPSATQPISLPTPPPAAPPPPAAAPQPAPPRQEPAFAPPTPAPSSSDDDDLLSLQRLSLSLDAEHDDPLSEIGPDPQLDDLGLLDEDEDDLEALDLDEEALPELDETSTAGASAFGGEPPPAPAGQPSARLAAAPSALGEDSLELSDEDDEGGQERIAELLAEGQVIFEQGDYQGAIDVWSRIFLIDISNGGASDRIEEARKKKAELERQAEEIFHEGVSHIENESLEEAKEAFRRVLEIDANHSLAREYLEQLEAGKVPTVRSRQSEAADLDELTGEAAAGALERSPSLEAAVQRDRVVVVKKIDKRLVALAALVAVVVIGSGFYIFTHKDKIFPNTTQAPVAPPPRIDPIARATKLHERGETEQALEVLRGLPEDDPAHDEASTLVAKWEAAIAAEEEIAAGPSPEMLQRRNLYLAGARQAHRERRFLLARKFFDRAGKILPLESEELALKLNCDAELVPLDAEIEKFQNREFTAIVRGLWLRREEDPNNHDVNRLLVDSYYNLALLDLQRGDAASAAEKLDQAMDVDPEDEDLLRLHLFAQSYAKRPQDLLYLIFVKHLPARDL